ncbi:MAG: zinc-dependent metalloprotease [Candidatus Aminicenantes bacterium]|nr:zinc-dependent metalloprotease [Candidatus Aminicenantes bacterium]
MEEAKTPDKPEKSFEGVVKGSKVLEGLFNLYLKEDKLYLEIRPEQFGRMYLFIPTLWTSMGNGGAGSYLPLKVFVWEKLEKKVLLLWKNTNVSADKSAEYQRALKNVVPDSIAFSFQKESEPHPERKSTLICLDDCFFTDLERLGSLSDPSQSYSVDRARTVWGKVTAFPKNIELEVRYTLTSSKPGPMPAVPDPSVFTLNVRYSMSEVPLNNGYRPRLADDRVGYFLTKVYDYDKLDLDGTVTHYINRWNLEKADPKEKVSIPKEPIVFWLENTIPPEYREPIRDGILEWNKAFERIGFKDALVVKEMPNDAIWDPADIRYNTIRWIPSLTGAGGGAMGPSRVNPLTGQILDADVTIRAPLNFIFSYNAVNMPLDFCGLGETNPALPGTINPWDKDNLVLGGERDFGVLDMLASGKVRDIRDVPREYIYDALKQLACHEVGHTLGLRHNFKGSSTISLQDLHNTALTSKQSIGNSIMEYLPVNLAPKGVKQGDYFQKTIGAWDYWAIEYGYRPMDAKSPKDEGPQLDKIAGRSTEAELVYGTDEDAYDLGPYSTSIDPLAMTFDLGRDPLAYAEQDLQRTRELWRQLEDRVLFEGKSYVYLRKAFESSLSRYFGTLARLTRWIGGIYHTRVHVGEGGKELPFRVAEYEKQQRAIDIIEANLLNPESFTFDPAFMQKLQFERFVDLDALEEAAGNERSPLRMDFSLSSYIQQSYRSILRSLYDPARLRRLQDNALLSAGKVLGLSEFLTGLHSAVWREVTEGKPVTLYRRILQQETLAQVRQALLKPSPSLPEDAAILFRYELKQLSKTLSAELSSHPELDLMTRAHLENCLDVIGQTLQAGYVKPPQP